MGAIPTQREIVPDAGGPPPAALTAQVRAHVDLACGPLAPGTARATVRAALADWVARGLLGAGRLTDHSAADALLVVSELVTNAVVHAGTGVEAVCALEPDGTLVVEVLDHHPARAPRGGAQETPHESPDYGCGLRLVAEVSEAWGITYRPGTKTVWARLPAAAAEGEGRAGAAPAARPAAVTAPGVRPRAGDDRDGTPDRPAPARRRPTGETPAVPGRPGTKDYPAPRHTPDGADGGVPASEGLGMAAAGSVAVAPVPAGPGLVAAGLAGSGGVAPVPAGPGLVAAGLAGSGGVAPVPAGPGPVAAGLAGPGGAAPAPAGPGTAAGDPAGAGTASADPAGPGRAAGDPAGPGAAVPAPAGPGAAVPAPAGPGAAPPELAQGRQDADRRDPLAADPGEQAPDGRAGRGPQAPHVPGLRPEQWWAGERAGWLDGYDERCGAGPGYAAEVSYPRRVPDRDWLGVGALSFLAEASDLLAGQLDEELVASLTGQLVVPRLADWCAVWLEDETLGRGAWNDDAGVAVGARLAGVWHASEAHVEELRRALEKEPPRPRDPWRTGPVGHPWPDPAPGAPGTALAYPLVAGGRPLGTLVIGRAGTPRFPDEVTGLVEDLGRRVALALGTARQYARQATISAVLQRGLLPGAVAEIPGLRSALVYEPCDKGGPSGDFYDLFPAGDGRWCFAIGDVQGKGPEAAVVTGLARPWLRLLAREGYGVAGVLDRLNQLLLDDATEAADAAARALLAAGGVLAPGDGPQTRFLSLLYGELVPVAGGVRCTLASAGHPLPLLLDLDGAVRPVAQPQTLLGVFEDTAYASDSFVLRPGDTLLCVTDGVTERRSGSRQFDDGDGLAAALASCAGYGVQRVAEHIRHLVHAFGDRPPEDDLALLVLQAD
ncbi:SpoIIE family protein phosphatase [Streptomyces sp. NPDC003717]|uniref:SpoIIE family protein phosphatase n=1 Tax=Streptomyces sp. NPDC003717 TaxID=3154276 RepID=UPI0033A1F7B0